MAMGGRTREASAELEQALQLNPESYEVNKEAVAYVRGPVLVSVAFPETWLAGLVIPTVILGFLILVRLPATVKALGRQVALTH